MTLHLKVNDREEIKEGRSGKNFFLVFNSTGFFTKTPTYSETVCALNTIDQLNYKLADFI